jgi:hypothetical protein
LEIEDWKPEMFSRKAAKSQRKAGPDFGLNQEFTGF